MVDGRPSRSRSSSDGSSSSSCPSRMRVGRSRRVVDGVARSSPPTLPLPPFLPLPLPPCHHLRLKSWVIYRKHRLLRQQDAHSADSVSAQARSDLIQAHPTSRPPLLSAWIQATDVARQAWKSLTQSTIHAASILDHLFSNISSYYFHSLARTPKAPTVINFAPWDTGHWLRTEHSFARQQECS